MPDVLGRQRAAAGRVHPQHDGLHILVLPSLAELLDEGLRVDAVLAVTLAVADIPESVEHRHFGAAAALRSERLGVGAQGHVVGILVIAQVQLGLDELLGLVRVCQLIHQLQRQRLLRGGAEQTVGDAVQLVGRELARLGDILQEDTPQRVGQHGKLLAVRLAHLVEEVGLHRALELPVTENLHVHIQLVQQVLVEHHLEGVPLQAEVADGVQQDLVRSSGHIVAVLRVYVAVGIDELARLLELHQGVADGFQRSRRSTHGAALQVDALDLGIPGRRLDGG